MKTHLETLKVKNKTTHKTMEFKTVELAVGAMETVATLFGEPTLCYTHTKEMFDNVRNLISWREDILFGDTYARLEEFNRNYSYYLIKSEPGCIDKLIIGCDEEDDLKWIKPIHVPLWMGITKTKEGVLLDIKTTCL